MQIWVVSLNFSTNALPDELFQRCLQQVDTESQAHVQRYFRRQDAWRCLIGRLLPRALLKARNIALGSINFKRTGAGKPFIEAPDLRPAIGYNITHDSDVIAMVSRHGDEEVVNKVGIDIMKRSLPKGETVSSFLRAIEDTLTRQELAMFTSELDTATAIKYIFQLWTLKEAYTKALGLGLGFDFKRIEYNVTRDTVTVDSVPPVGWEFLVFVVQVKESKDIYQGTIAAWVGGEHTSMNFVSNIENDPRFQFKDLSDLVDNL